MGHFSKHQVKKAKLKHERYVEEKPEEHRRIREAVIRQIMGSTDKFAKHIVKFHI